MGTDVERIVVSFRSIHEVWASLLDVGVATWLLGRQLSVACIVPAVIGTAAILAMLRVSALSSHSQKLWVERIEERLHSTSKTLGDMKAVKMLGLSQTLSIIIERSRQAEIQTSKKLRRLLVWQIFLSNMPVDLAPFATFMVFTVIAATKHGRSLVTTSAFTSLSLISLLTFPLLNFILAVPSLVQSFGCFERIQDFNKLQPDIHATEANLPAETFGSEELTRSTPVLELSNWQADSSVSEEIVTLRNVSFRWEKGVDPVLKELCLHIRKKKLTMVIGPVGSGKSTLIQSLLGETVSEGGQSLWRAVRTAYCSQVPWIMNDTVRNNVILFSPFDGKWYDYVMQLCGLEDEFNSASPFVLLDDVFSGLDAKTITVVLATHTRSLLPFADDIVQLKNGKKIDGLYSETFGSPLGVDHEVSATETQPDHLEKPGPSIYSQQRCSNSTVKRESDESEVSGLWRKEGDWSVYGYYIRHAGRASCALFIIFILISSFSTNFPTIWLKWWSDANAERPNKDIGLYLGVYGVLCATAVFGLMIACWILFLPIITQSALKLHTDLLATVFRAPLSFFQSTDLGKTTNRFSQDMDLIDMKIPVVAINALSEAANCAVKVVILCAVAKYLAVAVPFLGAILYIIQRGYLHTSRQLRLLDIEAKAPLYSHFLETIQGIATIRAYVVQSDFNEKAKNLLDASQKPVYMLYCVQQWLTLVLDLIVGAVAVILVAITVSLKSSFSASSVGVALTTVLTFNQALSSLIKYWTLLETSIGAVSRIKNFVKDTPTEKRGYALRTAPGDWPSEGAIIFSNVSIAHNAVSPPIIKDLNLSIAPGEKIAICGRSGSGKTSLILSLLQMKDSRSGSIMLDGIDLSSLHPDVVRTRINTIPQDPFFAPGSIRFNMDPHQAFTDVEIETAIRRVGLWSKVQEHGLLTSTALLEDWSIGQQQLLSLARALLSKSMVLIMDEAMSSVDHVTEALMQEIIETEFTRQTVISVIHRLDYIERFDRVAVLENGVLIECDQPSTLLARDSHLRKMFDSQTRRARGAALT
ncbi:MAG: hypothetical protein Q9213_005184 [Squamulea squamosa]